MNFTILRFEELESTNTEALNQARRGAEEGLCIVARQQSAGRGRQGRTWISEKDAGLYFSIVLRPKIETRFLSLITLMTAVGVYETLKTLALQPDIKWANDVHINGKKISGILAETTETSIGLAVIVGIGVNLKSSNFPAEIAELATSIENETGESVDFERFLENLTASLNKFYQILNEEKDAAAIRQLWLERSSYSYGKPVKVALENEIVTGDTRGIEENGALRVELKNGEIRIIQAGDVENLRAA
ncbi:MAG TPA: biotin--[acetyl-CoA-carboxylase] ligase [Pyrinomonadaceae bacterium]|jgi:BirA family biotin operon repressor/biotin-[acetyl-CoA-carboxylase] ligase